MWQSHCCLLGMKIPKKHHHEAQCWGADRRAEGVNERIETRVQESLFHEQKLLL